MISTADKIQAIEYAVEAGEKRLREAVDALAAEHRRLQRDRCLLERLRERVKLEQLGGKKLADAELGFSDDDDWQVYQGKNAGCPELHEPELWYFEPRDYDGDVYSEGYARREDAVEAARQWAAVQRTKEIAALENYPVHIGCGGEVTADRHSLTLRCHGCDSVVDQRDVAFPPETETEE